jgi:ABC-2 type transport system permease protein
VRKLFVASLKMLYRDRQAIFTALAFPVIFAVVFGLFDFGSTPAVTIGTVETRPSAVSRTLETGLRKVSAFKLRAEPSVPVALRKLSNGDLDVVVVAPSASSTAGSTQRIIVYFSQSNLQVAQVALAAIRQVADGLNLRLAGVTTPAVAVQARPVSGRTTSYYDFLLPGLVALGVMNFSIIGMGVAIARFREQRILRRIQATPLRPGKFLTAQVMARLVLSLIQAGLILAIGTVMFGAHVYGNVLWLLVLAAVGNLIFLNIGLAIAGRASSPDAAQGRGQTITIPMMFLSGVFFSTGGLPKVLRTVVGLLPLTPLLKAMRLVANEGKSITQTGHQLLLLGAWVLVSFALARMNFRFEDG